MEEFLERGALTPQTIRDLVASRAVVPCLFGSALRLEGVDDLLAALAAHVPRPPRREGFAARVFKVTHDDQGNRLAWLKLTGGELAVKDQLPVGQGSVRATSLRSSGARAVQAAGLFGHGAGAEAARAEKVNQIRVYQGAKFTAVDRVRAGEVCAVTGLTSVFPGDVLGDEPAAPQPLLAPVLTYAVLPGACDVHRVFIALRELAEEDPLLGVSWHEQLQEIRLQLMGPIQLEVVRQLLRDRHGFEIDFAPGGIAYRETVAAPVVGVGHFEPLRHYAEVHLLIEPLAPGAGLEFGSACDEDLLDRNWQRLFLTNAMEREHLGTLTGSPLADVRITLLAGATHPKHTQGGDCRQATYRAIRQGLMQARERGDAVLLEPWYDFVLEVPQELIGRAITDVQTMHGRFDTPLTRDDFAVLQGSAPVVTMQGYAVDLAAYTRGRGRLFCTLRGYEPCHNAAQVVAQAAYDPCADLAHTPDSVFCSHGAGYPVSWHEAPAAMHLTNTPRGTAPYRPADAAFFSSGA